MSLLNPKFKESVYNGLDFKEAPYETLGKFSIYVCKPKDYIAEAIEKYQKTQDQFTSPNKKFNDTKFSTQNKYHTENQNGQDDHNNPSNITSTTNNESKLKSKLFREVEQARALESANSKVQITDNDQHESHQNTQESQQDDHHAQQREYGSKTEANSPNYNTFKSNTNTIRSKKTTQGKTLSVFSKTSGGASLKESLYMDPRTASIPKSSIKNKIIENIIDNEDVIARNPMLMQSIFKLRDLNLLKKNEFHAQRYKGVGKIDYVYNDYHSRSTNPGYSRNYLMGGAFFCR